MANPRQRHRRLECRKTAGTEKGQRRSHSWLQAEVDQSLQTFKRTPEKGKFYLKSVYMNNCDTFYIFIEVSSPTAVACMQWCLFFSRTLSHSSMKYHCCPSVLLSFWPIKPAALLAKHLINKLFGLVCWDFLFQTVHLSSFTDWYFPNNLGNICAVLGCSAGWMHRS